MRSGRPTDLLRAACSLVVLATAARAYPGPQINGNQINPQTGITVSSLTANGQSGLISTQGVFTGTMTVQGNAFSVGAPTFVVSGGKVGIGTASPGAALEVKGAVPTYINPAVYVNANGAVIFKSGSSASSRQWGFENDIVALGDFAIFQSTAQTADASLAAGFPPRLYFKDGGNVGIGDTNPSVKLSVSSSAVGNYVMTVGNGYNAVGQFALGVFAGSTSAGDTTTTLVQFGDAGDVHNKGAIVSNGTSAVSYNTTSDRRLKENIVSTRYGLADLMRIGVVDFNFIADTTTVTNGLIAQDLRPIYPDAVSTNGDDGVTPLDPKQRAWGIDYGRITPLLIKAIQDQQALIEQLQQRVTALEAK